MMGFDRAYARGPWRAVPTPAFLADRGAGLRFQLAWAAGAMVALVLLAIALGGESRGLLLRGETLALIGEQAVPGLLLGLGMAVVLAWGGLDLSAGAVATLAAVVFAQQANPALGLLAALGCGLVNGLLVATLRVPGWLITGATLFLVQSLTRSLAGGTFARVDLGAFAWLRPLTGVLVLGAAAAAVVWLQVLPRGAPQVRRRWGRVADALPYLLSAGLAGLSGLHGAVHVGAVDTLGLASGFEPVLIAVLGGTFLGAGRTSAAGTIVAALGLAAVRFASTAAGDPSWVQGVVDQLLFLLAMLASVGMHVVAARRYAPLPPPPDEALEREQGGLLFDRGLFNGPGRSLPIPVHLIDRRWALRIELTWSVALLVALGVVAAASAAGLPAPGDWASLGAAVGAGAVVPLLLALGGCAVVARGGWDLSAPGLALVAAFLAAEQGDPWGALILGATVGLANGALVALGQIPGWIATAVSAILLSAARLLALWRPVHLPATPEQDWLLTAGMIAAGLAAAGAFAWLQLRPGHDLDRPLVRWRVRLGDGLPYVFSGVLAALAGVYLMQRAGGVSPRLSAGAEALPIVILAGCWLGAGRANVLGVVVAALLAVAIQDGFVLANRDVVHAHAVLAGLVLAALAASRLVHLAVGRAHARALAAGAPRAVTRATGS